MKKIITTALATMVAVYGYSQTYLPLTGGTLTGPLTGTSATFNGNGVFKGLHLGTNTTVPYSTESLEGLTFGGQENGVNSGRMYKIYTKMEDFGGIIQN
jgi:hypothetical protein